MGSAGAATEPWLARAAIWFVRRAGLARFASIFLASGLALAAIAGARPILAVVGTTFSTGLAVVGSVISRRGREGQGLPLVCLGILGAALFSGLILGSWRVSAIAAKALDGTPGCEFSGDLVVTGEVRHSGGWQSGVTQVSGVDRLVYVELAPGCGEGLPQPLARGMLLRVKGRLDVPQGPTTYGYDQSKQLAREGIRLVLRVTRPADIGLLGWRGGVTGFFDRLHNSAAAHLELGPDARIGEVLTGVVLGEKSGIDPKWTDAFRRAGTAHMLSVSGLHVASLVAVMLGLASALRLSLRAGSLLGMGAALFMVFFVGPKPPILRAVAMIVVLLAGRLLGRSRDSWQGLAFAAMVVLALDPYAVYEAGFQLSFSAIAGILALAKRLEKRLRTLPRAVASGLAVSISATLGTAPVSLLVFGRTSLVAPLANLLVVPVLPVVTGLGISSAFLGFAWTGLSAFLDTLAAVPLYWVVLVSRVCGAFPVLGREQLGAVLFGGGCTLAALPMAVALWGSEPDPSRVGFMGRILARSPCLARILARRPRSKRRAVLAAMAVILLSATAGGFSFPLLSHAVDAAVVLARARNWPTGVEVRVLDVGQGAAVLVRTAAHKTVLVDAGPRDCDLLEQLRALGVKRLDAVIISHPHLDHFGGLSDTVEGIKVDLLVDGVQVVTAPVSSDGLPASEPGAQARLISFDSAEKAARDREAVAYLELRERLQLDGAQVQTVGPGWSLEVDDVDIRLFAPEQPLTLVRAPSPWALRGGPPSGDELNSRSVVALLSMGDFDFLLPGDAEADVLGRYELPPACEVLVVPHHGSRGAVSGELLSHLASWVGVIPVGENNSFGHPDNGTLDLLNSLVPTVLRTDRCGWVSFTIEHGVLTMRSERQPSP